MTEVTVLHAVADMDEVTVFHVAAEGEEVVLSSSSEVVDSIADIDMENKQENLCNGVDGKTVKESIESDGSDVGVNRNGAVDGVPEESNGERNPNGTDEYCIGTGDQEEDPIELCQAESPVDEQNSRDVIEGEPEDGVLETSMAGDNGVSVSEDAVIDSSVESSDIVETSTSVEGGMSCDMVETDHSALPIIEGGKFSDIAETDAGAFFLVFGSFPVSVAIISAEISLNSDDHLKIQTETSKWDEAISSSISERDNTSASIVSDNLSASMSNPDSDQICGLTDGGIQSMPFHYLIKVPRYNDESLKEKIRLAQIHVDDKTRTRDAIRIEMQSLRATCKEYGNDFNAAVSQERKARDLLSSKRLEIESIQSVMDIDVKIRNMEHTMQHETLPLKDEKNLIREIKRLKQTREKHSSIQDEIQLGLDRKDRLKSLKKEAEQLKADVLNAEAVTKAAKRKYHDESEKLNELQSRFKAADDIQQEAYAQLRTLKKHSYEKGKHFWQYRDDLNKANDLASKGGKEALQSFCTNQVEKFMELWNENDEFRKEYVRCNARSTIRRLRTLDGRALGPDEKPPVIPHNETVAKDEAQEKVVLAKGEKENDKPVLKVLEQKEEISESVAPANVSMEEAGDENMKRRKEEEEEEAVKLREQLRLKEMAKAKEALERKRRTAERTRARDAERALKEAEKKEKQREKRAKKKERRKAATAANDASVTDEAAETNDASITDEAADTNDTSITDETLVETPKEPKANSVLKRGMQPWLWVILTSLLLYVLFLTRN
ncbi:proton pump-interactor 1-like [Hibiscus syriacus]|uniref:proton pump-interactor 1-like n=1 Tax=Hibiscus syriacus TaxID=106335 RepID=UPI001922521F|nr:proton pump-interactor 1-like [Hibiscus syriacus]